MNAEPEPVAGALVIVNGGHRYVIREVVDRRVYVFVGAHGSAWFWRGWLTWDERASAWRAGIGPSAGVVGQVAAFPELDDEAAFPELDARFLSSTRGARDESV